jgi:ABC-type transport system involved in multi-copper enzyme maturation permease subunit
MMSWGRVQTIAENTVREAVRNKVLYALVFFAVLLIGVGVLLSTLSYVEQERIIQDVGLSAIRLFSALIAIFLGVGLIHKEVDRRTIYTIVTKAVTRGEFLVGKYLGLVATVWMQVVVMSAAFLAVSWLTGAPLHAQTFQALLLTAAEVAVLVAIATFFSSFTTPMLASFFTGGFYVVGHLTRDLKQLGSQSDVESVQQVAAFLYRVLPDLESFNLTIEALHGLPVTPAEVWLPLGYAVGYVAIVLMAGVLVFQRKDFR